MKNKRIATNRNLVDRLNISSSEPTEVSKASWFFGNYVLKLAFVALYTRTTNPTNGFHLSASLTLNSPSHSLAHSLPHTYPHKLSIMFLKSHSYTAVVTHSPALTKQFTSGAQSIFSTHSFTHSPSYTSLTHSKTLFLNSLLISPTLTPHNSKTFSLSHSVTSCFILSRSVLDGSIFSPSSQAARASL